MTDKRKSVTIQEEKTLLNPSGAVGGGSQNNLNINKTTEEVTEEQLVNYNAEWSDEHEMILVEWADKAMCYRWLHSKARIKYYIKNIWFTIPVIIISTLTGTANFAIERVPEEYQHIYTIGVGTFNIIAGIITTIAQFLKIGELNEAHRVSSITWDKFYRNIKIELSKRRTERVPAFQMLKISKEEYDRLMETSPPIGDEIIKKFKDTFSGGTVNEKKGPNKKQQNYIDIIKPEICDIMETTKNFLYKQSEEEKRLEKTKSIVGMVKENKEQELQKAQVKKFIDNFNREYKREPTLHEIHNNLDDTINLELLNSLVNKDKNSALELENIIINKD
uniref:SMODS and SLOG-associating 2TM effector domain-containing protein n=1 Tax=Nucleocytoviricota sp. TaxID=2809609 RepID=A0A9E8K119_9VIRU|nr:hypothetical protein [Nucleocytoviricota sp.]UZT29062.1 hypothetical protein [Nucleocytoviricota sp.]